MEPVCELATHIARLQNGLGSFWNSSQFFEPGPKRISRNAFSHLRHVCGQKKQHRHLRREGLRGRDTDFWPCMRVENAVRLVATVELRTFEMAMVREPF